MAEAIAWGALAASSLIIGALLGLARTWSPLVVGHVLAFGAGALISAVSFDLAQEGAKIGDAGTLAFGLAAGALTYFFLDRAVERWQATNAVHAEAGAGVALAVGALLDGIPEQVVLGIGVASGEAVSAGLVVAIFVSNLPEAIGASTNLRQAGYSPKGIRRMWLAVAALSIVAAAVGFAVADNTSGNARAAIDGFAAGALLVMLIDSMIPEARRNAGRTAGLVTVLGFALAAGLSGVS